MYQQHQETMNCEHTNNEYVEQIIRPTGLLDPTIEIKTKYGTNR